MYYESIVSGLKIKSLNQIGAKNEPDRDVPLTQLQNSGGATAPSRRCGLNIPIGFFGADPIQSICQ